jgi:hypothetical protein
MTIPRDNDTRFETEPLIDGNGNAITVGTVLHAVLSQDRATTYIADAAMTHVGDGGVTKADGTWRRDEPLATVNLIPTTAPRVWKRVKVGSPVVATIWMVEDVGDRVDRTT